jgi:hypothetical protein
MNKVRIGIDPGSIGGIVEGADSVIAYPMPETEADVVGLLREIVERANIEGKEVVATIEKVSGFAGGDGQPGGAMFTFGRGAGIIYGALYMAQVRIEEVTPQKWQKALSLGNKQHVKCPSNADAETRKRFARQNAQYKTEWKNKLKAEAQRLYPSIKVTLKTADALLIYEYAKRTSF